MGMSLGNARLGDALSDAEAAIENARVAAGYETAAQATANEAAFAMAAPSVAATYGLPSMPSTPASPADSSYVHIVPIDLTTGLPTGPAVTTPSFNSPLDFSNIPPSQQVSVPPSAATGMPAISSPAAASTFFTEDSLGMGYANWEYAVAAIGLYLLLKKK